MKHADCHTPPFAVLRHRRVLVTLAFLCSVGLLTVAGMGVCDRWVVTPERTSSWMAAHPLRADMPAVERSARCASLAEQVNQLSLAQRQDPDFNAALNAYQGGMSQAELADFYDLCFARSIGQMIKVLNAMTPAQRQSLLERVLQDKPTLLGRGGNFAGDGRLSAREQDKMIKNGLELFMKDATPATRMDVIPLLLEMQVRMQRGRLW